MNDGRSRSSPGLVNDEAAKPPVNAGVYGAVVRDG
jgi:hypothetical protein